MPPIARRTVTFKKPSLVPPVKSTDCPQGLLNVGKSKAIQQKVANVKETVAGDQGKTPARVPSGNKGKATGKFSSNAACVSDLPDFAILDWRYTFLPTLYDKFFTSSEPFAGFFKGSDDFVGLLQLTVEEVYPGVDYLVTRMDPIHAIVSSLVSIYRSH